MPKTEGLEEISVTSMTENWSGCTETDIIFELFEIEMLEGTFAEISGSFSAVTAVRCAAGVLPDSFSMPR